MNITWKNIIEIIEQMFEINQADIAACLGVNRSAISKLKSGKQSSIQCKNNEIFQRIFDPNEKNSFAYGKSPQDLLEDLKAVVKELDLIILTKDLRDDDYREFVLELLRSVKKNKPDNSSPTNDFSTDEAKTEEKNQEVDTIQDCIQDDVPVEKEGSTVDATKILKDDCCNNFETVSLYSDRENELGSSSPTNDFSTDEAKTEEKNQEVDTIQDCIQDDVPVETGENAIQECMHYENGYSQLAIPKNCKVCLCCDNWKGNVSNAYKSSRGVEGKCIMYDKNTLSVDGRSCERFYPNYGRITQYNFLQPLLEFKK